MKEVVSAASIQNSNGVPERGEVPGVRFLRVEKLVAKNKAVNRLLDDTVRAIAPRAHRFLRSGGVGNARAALLPPDPG